MKSSFIKNKLIKKINPNKSLILTDEQIYYLCNSLERELIKHEKYMVFKDKICLTDEIRSLINQVNDFLHQFKYKKYGGLHFIFRYEIYNDRNSRSIFILKNGSGADVHSFESIIPVGILYSIKDYEAPNTLLDNSCLSRISHITEMTTGYYIENLIIDDDVAKFDIFVDNNLNDPIRYQVIIITCSNKIVSIYLENEDFRREFNSTDYSSSGELLSKYMMKLKLSI